MPKCQVCGNFQGFGASKIPPAATYANGQLSGIVGDFNQQRELIQIISSGVDKETIAAAAQNPQEFFDLCVRCGHESVVWDE